MAHNLLVTGGAGFIGSAYVQQRVAADDNVVVLDAFTYAGHRANLADVADKITLIEGSITDGDLVEKLLREHSIDGIVNFAAESHVDNSITGSAVFMETNIMGTYAMLEAARRYWNDGENDLTFLHVSTDEVYGSLGESGHFTEDSPYQPNSPYSASKAASDHLVRAWHHTYGLPTVTTNCSNNYGPRQFPEKLIPLMIHNALAGKQLPIYGDGKNVRDWIYVEDHTRGIHTALCDGQAGETYCFGGRAEKTNNEVVNTLCQHLDALAPREDGNSYSEQITYVTDRPGHDQRYAIDDSKAEAELGFSRQHDFSSGLKATVEWYLANNAWRDEVLSKEAA